MPESTKKTQAFATQGVRIVIKTTVFATQNARIIVKTIVSATQNARIIKKTTVFATQKLSRIYETTPAHPPFIQLPSCSLSEQQNKVCTKPFRNLFKICVSLSSLMGGPQKT